jgi:hypothetical protein
MKAYFTINYASYKLPVTNSQSASPVEFSPVQLKFASPVDLLIFRSELKLQTVHPGLNNLRSTASS